MPRIFGREYAATPANKSLVALMSDAFAVMGDASAQDEDRAMLDNLTWDHRVSAARASEFFDYLTTKLLTPTAIPITLDKAHEALELGLKDYQERRVRRNPNPEFADGAVNGENIIFDRGRGVNPPAASATTEFANVLCLSELPFRDMLVTQEPVNDPLLREFFFDATGKPWPMGLDRRLDQLLSTRNDAARREFVGQLLALLARHNEVEPFQPTWATSWNEFARDDVLNGGPERWTNALGVLFKPGRWYVLLKYPVSPGMVIARPTILDAGWSSRHYPSPKHNDALHHGHPVDLHDPATPAAGVLLPEYIHKAIQFLPEHIHAIAVTKPNAASVGALKDQRQNHRHRLVAKYGVDINP